MPLRFVLGNLFDSGAEALVNPVNCVGVMGAGLAKQFKQRYPNVFAEYRIACQLGEITPGRLVAVTYSSQPTVILFPTKDDWRNPSQLAWIDSGLIWLRGHLRMTRIEGIAVPPLGCGLGGLKWSAVKPLIKRHPGDLDCQVMVYAPKGGRP